MNEATRDRELLNGKMEEKKTKAALGGFCWITVHANY